jgi:NAD-dependent deacetylase
MKPIEIDRYRRIVILTGAGISVASGIRPFRGPSGLWETTSGIATDVSTLERDPHAIWRTFGPLRTQLQTATPNAAHSKLAELEQRLRPGQEFLLLTQNIDGLHQRAGSRNVVELHGSVHRTRCSASVCDLPPYTEIDANENQLPICPRCGAGLRLDLVLFGEDLPIDAVWKAKDALNNCDLFIAIGTSGTVAPASNFVRSADYAGARTILINLEPMEPRNPYYQEEYLGRAEEVLPKLW